MSTWEPDASSIQSRRVVVAHSNNVRDGGCRASQAVLVGVARALELLQPDTTRAAGREWADRRLDSILGLPRLLVAVVHRGDNPRSAAAAGFRAAAVLSAAYPDQAIAHELSRLPEALVIPFDQDEADQAAAQRLTSLLDAKQRHPVNLTLPADDLADELLRSSNWPKEFGLRMNASLRNLAANLSSGQA